MDVFIKLKVPEELIPVLVDLLIPLGVEYDSGRPVDSGNFEVDAYVSCENLDVVKSLLEEEGIKVVSF